jgi:hypothetical protein
VWRGEGSADVGQDEKVGKEGSRRESMVIWTSLLAIGIEMELMVIVRLYLKVQVENGVWTLVSTGSELRLP